MVDLKFCILMPVYNGANIIGQTIRSILSQSFSNYEIIIQDDASDDNTEQVIESFNDRRIKFFKNEENLGYTQNLETLRKKATGDVVYLMGQDDILGKDALLNTYKAFKISDDIGAVTRPYYWFDKDIYTPVRAKKQLNPRKDEIVKITDDYRKVIMVFKTLDQLSGLAYRRKYMDVPFHKDVFPCHVYPFASIFKKHPIVFLKDYNLAVRIGSSQTRSLAAIYEKSPLQSWVEMFESVFCEEEFKRIKVNCIKNFVAVNYIGLVQIRNYGKYRQLLREIKLLVKYRWLNLLNFKFWSFSLGTMIMPRKLLRLLVDYYKNLINANLLKDIKFEYLV